MPSPPANLHCILLNACGAAYNIAPGTSNYTSDQTFSPNVPYQGDPKPACGGLKLINAATVGQTPFGIIVAFRGTLPIWENDIDKWLDWLQDFFVEPTTCPSGPNKVPGEVHRGFFDATTSIIDAVKDSVSALNPSADNPVFVTGHSKGGALASMGAYILSQNRGIPNVQPVVTFASPRPGDVAFRNAFQTVLGQTRYENFNDIVPLVPPSDDLIRPVVDVLRHIPFDGTKLAGLFQQADFWDYVPVGGQKFVTSSFEVITDESTTDQTDDVLKEILADVLKRDFTSFAVAHSLDPGNGYSRGVCT
jgi:hypothetical protein